MIDIDTIKNEIVEQLKPLHPEKIILFGSYAWGEPGEDSDIDLYVVTNDEFIPNNYQEKREVVRKVSRRLRDIRQRFSMDLLVHTKSMSDKFFELNSSFSKEIKQSGLRLL